MREERSAEVNPGLTQDLEDLADVAKRMLQSPGAIEGDDNDFRLMALFFAARQTEHARSILALGPSPDATIIARTMIEGLVALLYAADDPIARAGLWSGFAYVEAWRAIRDGEALPEGEVEAVKDWRARGDDEEFLTEKERGRLAAERRPDPYRKNWWPKVGWRGLFGLIDADDFYQRSYRFLSSWLHWSHAGIRYFVSPTPGGSGIVVRFDRASFTTTALEAAFKVLWHTLHIVERAAPGILDGVHGDLAALRARNDERLEPLKELPRV